MYRNCPERVAVQRRQRKVYSATGWTLIAGAFLFSLFGILDGRWCVLIAAAGGFAEGWSFMFLMAAEQMPILVRYTTLHTEEVQKRLEGDL
jgi:hypothetical protein